MSFLNIEEYAARYNMTAEQVEKMCEEGYISKARKTESGWEIQENATKTNTTKKAGKKKSKAKKIILTIIFAIIVVFTILVVLFIRAGISWDVESINCGVDDLLQQPIDENIYDKIEAFDKMYETMVSPAKKAAGRDAEINDFKAKVEGHIIARAEEIEADIKVLVPYDRISSEEEFNKALEKAESLSLSDTNSYEKHIKEKVKNYGDLTTYMGSLEKIRTLQIKDCDKCITADCSGCKGTGKIIFYEHGDHGKEIISDGDCPVCDGSGQRANRCKVCNGEGTIKYYTYTFNK